LINLAFVIMVILTVGVARADARRYGVHPLWRLGGDNPDS
jgi:hypothetical protein